MQEIYYLSLSQLSQLLLSKAISCKELIDIFLKRIHQVNPTLNAIVALNEELSTQYALKADKALAKKKSLGKLHGLPITIKDCFLVKNYRCTLGTEGLKNHIAQTDSFCVKKLKDAGGIILGITNVPEMCTAFETDNLLYGKTMNPFDISKTPGGSSGGEASIIAAGGSALGLGTDGAGSIRIPAHFTGIAGMKPTFGLLSRKGLHGILQGAAWINPLGTVGPMARYVEDLDIALSVLSGHDLGDPFSIPLRYGDSKKVQLSQLRVAFYTDDGSVTPQDLIQDLIKEAAMLLTAYCRSVTEKVPEKIHQAYDLIRYYFFGTDGGHYYQSQLTALGTHSISPLQEQFIKETQKQNFPSSEWMKIFEKIGQFKMSMHAFLENYDVIICPPCATTAKDHGVCFQPSHNKDFSYAMPYNLTGWPAVVMPCGKDKNGLPIGIQIVGKPWNDHVVLAVAKQLENHFGGWQAFDSTASSRFEKGKEQSLQKSTKGSLADKNDTY